MGKCGICDTPYAFNTHYCEKCGHDLTRDPNYDGDISFTNENIVITSLNYDDVIAKYPQLKVYEEKIKTRKYKLFSGIVNEYSKCESWFLSSYEQRLQMMSGGGCHYINIGVHTYYCDDIVFHKYPVGSKIVAVTEDDKLLFATICLDGGFKNIKDFKLCQSCANRIPLKSSICPLCNKFQR